MVLKHNLKLSTKFEKKKKKVDFLFFVFYSLNIFFLMNFLKQMFYNLVFEKKVGELVLNTN